ncbi:MAG: TIGR02921 family PEP-CTERM protein, partial [Myxococcales bacterium]|nr:TIGR02921 family PEP-CTERM protein [Myxococcales bacterium]
MNETTVPSSTSSTSSPPSPPSPASPPTSASAPKRSVWQRLRGAVRARPLIHLLFWSWHAIWVLAVVFGLAPQLLPALLVDTLEGEVPWGITLSALGLTFLPVLTLLGGWRLRHDHWKLLRLFYGVGGVAFTLLFFRLFFVRQATPGVQLLLGTLAAGAAFYTAELFGGLARVGRGAAVVRMVGYSALLIIGVYIGITMGLYTIPVAVAAVPEVLRGIGHVLTEGLWWRMLAYSPFLLVFGVFGLYSFTLLLGLPVAVAILYTRGWWRGLAAWSAERPRAWGLVITAATVSLWLLAFGWLTAQPQTEAFARLRTRPATLAQQADHLAHADSIREGLLNAHLSPYRYWGSRGDNVHLARLYRRAFGASDDVMGPQHAFNALAAPLLYEGGSLWADRAEAAIRYEQFFDQPLQAGEREAVLAAVSATYDRDRAEAGLLDVGQRKVLLRRQEVSMQAEGDVARFTLHEVYDNETRDQQEIFYYFSLPEHAAVTGLWLGDDGDPQRFGPVVAPRGAAQQVYRQQRERRVDPALIEQVGPRQYRLRAFPIPARARSRSADPGPVHLWLEWTVLGGPEGWPAPRLAEARNVFWDDRTVRTIDGASSGHEGWLPERFEGRAAPEAHTLELAGVRVRAVPADPDAAA